MNHMASVLTGSPSSSRPELSRPESSSMSTSSETSNTFNDRFDLSSQPAQDMPTCPAHCACTCPQVNINSNPSMIKKVDLDVTLLPCARTAAYQLDLAIKLCKRKSLF